MLLILLFICFVSSLDNDIIWSLKILQYCRSCRHDRWYHNSHSIFSGRYFVNIILCNILIPEHSCRRIRTPTAGNFLHFIVQILAETLNWTILWHFLLTNLLFMYVCIFRNLISFLLCYFTHGSSISKLEHFVNDCPQEINSDYIFETNI